MRTRIGILALLMGLMFSTTAPLRAVPDQGDQDQTSRLISRLGSNKFTERTQASKTLERMGAPALAALRKAIQCEDMEISRRASHLVERIEKHLEAAALMAPTRVHLVCKDMAVTDAVAELARKSKYDIQIDQRSRDQLAKRKITLDTGNVTFWEALDHLCQKANLVEGTPQFGGYAEPIQRLVPDNRGRRVPPRGMPQRIRQFQAVPAQQRQANRAVIQNLQIRAAAALPIQVQMPANAAVPIPVQPAIIRGSTIYYSGWNPNNGQIILADGKPQALATDYAGAFRFRLIPSSGARDPLAFQLEVSVESRLKNWSMVGPPRIQQVADDQGQDLALANEAPSPNSTYIGQMALRSYVAYPPAMPGYRQSVPVRLRPGDKPARALKRFRGTLAVEVITPPEPLIAVDHVLQAAGKTVKGKKGGWLKVLEIKKEDNGNYQVRYEMETPDSTNDGLNAIGGFGRWGRGIQVRQIQRLQVIQIRGNGNVIIQQTMDSSNPGGLSLVDAKGKAYPVVGMTSRNVNGAIEQSLTFQAVKGHGEPARLVYTGQRKVTIDVPFALKDVKLP